MFLIACIVFILFMLGIGSNNGLFATLGVFILIFGSMLVYFMRKEYDKRQKLATEYYENKRKQEIIRNAMKDVNLGGVEVKGNMVISSNSGQVSLGGKNISQSQVQSSSTIDIEKLKKSLLDLREELAKLDIPSETQYIIKGDVIAAHKEASKDNPKISNIKARIESVIEALKEAGLTVKNISEICVSLKIVAEILGIPLFWGSMH
jgi:hypothetical protein